MGVAITKIVPTKTIGMEYLQGKTLAVDGHNMLYQFLTTIRGPDGAALTDSEGRVTSHLIGLFSRTSNFLQKGMKLIFVFDGAVPALKRQELSSRRARKEEAKEKYEKAKERGDEKAMRKYGGRTARLTDEMLGNAHDLLDAMGIPWMEAPGEGEAQAAHLVKSGKAWAVLSQDADALLYGAPRIVKNLAITGKRKLPGKSAYVNIEPELITCNKVLEDLDLDLDQLRVLSVLIGTDYDPGGVHGIGPKRGLKMLQEHGHEFEKVFEDAKWEEHWDIDWKEILDVFENMPVQDPGEIRFGAVDEDRLKELLVGEHDFSENRVGSTLEKLRKATEQKGLGEFF